MKSVRSACKAMGGVACLIAASTMASQSANAQQSGAEIARQVVNSNIQSITQSTRDQIQTRTLNAPQSSSAHSSRERRARNGVSHREGS
jgi:hypothetical protein